jgi:hypothetical protein
MADTHTHLLLSAGSLEGNCGGRGEPGNVDVVVVSESRRARGRRPSAGSSATAAVGNTQTGLHPEAQNLPNHVGREQGARSRVAKLDHVKK